MTIVIIYHHLVKMTKILLLTFLLLPVSQTILYSSFLDILKSVEKRRRVQSSLVLEVMSSIQALLLAKLLMKECAIKKEVVSALLHKQKSLILLFLKSFAVHFGRHLRLFLF